jgi:hypothetical protein
MPVAPRGTPPGPRDEGSDESQHHRRPKHDKHHRVRRRDLHYEARQHIAQCIECQREYFTLAARALAIAQGVDTDINVWR